MYNIYLWNSTEIAKRIDIFLLLIDILGSIPEDGHTVSETLKDNNKNEIEQNCFNNCLTFKTNSQ